jgi:N-acetylmuramoyl-L-alanine amidase
VPPSPIVDGPALRPGDRSKAVAALKKRFRKFGYCLGETDEFEKDLEAILRAFQRHFRPERIDGIADLSTQATLDRLLDALRPG